MLRLSIYLGFVLFVPFFSYVIVLVIDFWLLYILGLTSVSIFIRYFYVFVSVFKSNRRVKIFITFDLLLPQYKNSTTFYFELRLKV